MHKLSLEESDVYAKMMSKRWPKYNIQEKYTMANQNISLLLIVCLIGVSGCAQYWYQEGVSYQQCLRDREDCFQELQKRTSFTYTGKYEFEYMTQCMQEKGYRLVTEKELPMDVRRSEPNSTLHWRAKGVAGTLETP